MSPLVEAGASTPELLPCPFCGERLAEHGEGRLSRWWAHADARSDCIAAKMRLRNAGDFTRWNLRAPTAREIERGEAIRMAREGLTQIAEGLRTDGFVWLSAGSCTRAKGPSLRDYINSVLSFMRRVAP